MKEISTWELQEELESGKELYLIDVREDDEVAISIIPGAVHIPMGEITSRIDELDKETPYIIVCRSGNRSGKVAAYLEEQGYDATNMVGGMMEWEGEEIR